MPNRTCCSAFFPGDQYIILLMWYFAPCSRIFALLTVSINIFSEGIFLFWQLWTVCQALLVNYDGLSVGCFVLCRFACCCCFVLSSGLLSFCFVWILWQGMGLAVVEGRTVIVTTFTLFRACSIETEWPWVMLAILEEWLDSSAVYISVHQSGVKTGGSETNVPDMEEMCCFHT